MSIVVFIVGVVIGFLACLVVTCWAIGSLSEAVGMIIGGGK